MNKRRLGLFLLLTLVLLTSTITLVQAETTQCHDGISTASFSVDFLQTKNIAKTVSLGGSEKKSAKENEQINLITNGKLAKDLELNLDREGLSIQRGSDNQGNFLWVGTTGKNTNNKKAVTATITFNRAIITGFQNAKIKELALEKQGDGKGEFGTASNDEAFYHYGSNNITFTITVTGESDVFKIYWDFPTLCTCVDGIDNEGDGLIDSQDPGCWLQISNPNTYSKLLNNESRATSQCQDGIDNDGDGYKDYPNDFGCTNAQDNDETLTKAECQDGIDNDFDGLVDLADFGCLFNQDNSENTATSRCQNNVDDDGDGLIDLLDPGCSSPTDNDEYNFIPTSICGNGIIEGLEQCDDGNTNSGDGCSNTCTTETTNNTTYQCSDGIDNDGDGYTDYPNDFGCTSTTDNDEYNFIPTSICGNGIIEGLEQCDDGNTNSGDGCSNTCTTETTNNTTYQCSDGIDNDGDGYTDYPNDFGCTSTTDNDETNNGIYECSDGIDNDNDNYIDQADPDCNNNTDNNETTITNNTTYQCSDGIDNDGDGKIDLNDQGCTDSNDNDETDTPPTNTTYQCSDGIDNDGDGKIDLNDPDCSSSTDNQEKKSSSGSSSSNKDDCTEQWTCNAWDICDGQLQIRTCNDINRCGTTKNQPLLTRSCTSSLTQKTTSISLGTNTITPQTTYQKTTKTTIPTHLLVLLISIILLIITITILLMRKLLA